MAKPKKNATLVALFHEGFRYAMSLTHDRETAEDILQDAWLAILKAKGPQQKPYLFKAIKSRFINQYRREMLVTITSIDEEMVGAGEQIPGATDVNLDNLSLTHIDKHLAILRPLEREALYLSAIEGYTAQEISELTEQPRGSVLSLLFRAKNKLKKALTIEQRRVNS